MECPECRFSNRDGAKFCSECGFKFQIKCSQCGKEIRIGSKFCDECGHNLKPPEVHPPIPYDQPASYTPKHLADQILTTRSAIEGERKLVTVLFADVANYTAMAGKLDPEEIHEIMDGCFQILMREIHRFEGTINQFTGDGIMALFGAPIAHEDHAQRACHTALSIQNSLSGYAKDVKNRIHSDFAMRLGLNSGPVVVGAIGDDLRMDYTAIGDTTNLASRLEHLANPGTVLVSTNTFKLVQEFFDFETLGSLRIKGKQEAQQAYQLIGATHVETRIQAASVKGLSRFVGRQQELRALSDVFEKVKSGQGQMTGVIGEAGVGKSRLLYEFKNMFSENEFTFLEGRCLHYGSSMPYLPVLDILRTYFDIEDTDQELVILEKIRKKLESFEGRLKSILPPVHDLLSLKVEDEKYLQLDPPQKKIRTFEGLRDVLIHESQTKPLVIAVEDLHWIDKTSEEFIGYLIDWMAGARILLILLYRPEYTHGWGSKSYYSKLGLNQLSAKTSTELVKAILEDGEISPELNDMVIARSAGNPLFVEELTHSLRENGTIECKNQRYVLTCDVSAIEIPDTIQAVIAARIDRIEDNLKRIFRYAYRCSRAFDSRHPCHQQRKRVHPNTKLKNRKLAKIVGWVKRSATHHNPVVMPCDGGLRFASPTLRKLQITGLVGW